MPVETAANITQLDPTQPQATDSLGDTDDHLRLLKACLKATFTAFTGTTGITVTEAQINAACSAFNGNTVIVPASSPNAGAVLLKSAMGNDVLMTSSNNGVLLVRSQNADWTTGLVNTMILDGAGNASFAGTVNCSQVFQGYNPLLPYGCIIMWAGTPEIVPAGWHLCDGTNGTPDLRDRFVIGAGASYGPWASGGATAASAGTTAAGSHSHSTDVQGAHDHAGWSDVAGYHAHGGAVNGHVLTQSEMPSHSHGYVMVSSGSGIQPGGGLGNVGAGSDATGGNASHDHGINGDGSHSHVTQTYVAGAHGHNISAVGDHAHSVTVATMPPFLALAYIMKL